MTHTVLKSALAPPPATHADAVEAFGRLVSAYIAELQSWHNHDTIVKTQSPLRAQPKWSDYAKHKDQSALYLKDNSAWKAERLAHHDPYPSPVAHPDIIAAVATDVGKDGTTTFSADFEVVNDDPTPSDILASKKTSLFQQVLQAEDTAKASVLLPAGKRRAADMRENDIRTNDAKVASDFLKKHSDDQKAALAEASAAYAAASAAHATAFAAYQTTHSEWLEECKARIALDPKAELPEPPLPPPLPAVPAPPKQEQEDVGSLVAAQVAASRSPADTQHLQDQESRRSKIDGIVRAAAQAMSDIEDLTVDNVDAYQIPLLT
jgi:hypothetical protein